jgi:hypothetical protein
MANQTNFIFRNGTENHIVSSIDQFINLANRVGDSRQTTVKGLQVQVEGSVQPIYYDFNQYDIAMMVTIKTFGKKTDHCFIQFEDGGRIMVDIIRTTEFKG